MQNWSALLLTEVLRYSTSNVINVIKIIMLDM